MCPFEDFRAEPVVFIVSVSSSTSNVFALIQITDIINFRIPQTFALPPRFRQAATVSQCTTPFSSTDCPYQVVSIASTQSSNFRHVYV